MKKILVLVCAICFSTIFVSPVLVSAKDEISVAISGGLTEKEKQVIVFCQIAYAMVEESNRIQQVVTQMEVLEKKGSVLVKKEWITTLKDYLQSLEKMRMTLENFIGSPEVISSQEVEDKLRKCYPLELHAKINIVLREIESLNLNFFVGI